MNQTLELLIKLIDALAWPTMAGITVFVLKSEIKSLLPIIKHLRIGPLEAEFEQKILEAQERYAPDLLPIPIELEETTDDRISKLISVDPRSAILEAWRNLEHSLQRAVIQRSGSPVPDVSTSYKAIQAAMKLHLFSLTMKSIFLISCVGFGIKQLICIRLILLKHLLLLTFNLRRHLKQGQSLLLMAFQLPSGQH